MGLVWLTAAVSAPLFSQGEQPLKLEPVSGSVYCLSGEGGNVSILSAKEGLLVVDAKIASKGADVLKKLREINAGPVLYLINTHYHGDHTGGNPIVGKGARIIGHENCRAAMVKHLKPEETPASVGAADITYRKKLSIRFGGETVHMLHFGAGHTSGDTVVVFEQAGVIHTGDLFFNGLPPYIDAGEGSDTKNWIATIEELVKRYPDFKVIPGHGPIASMTSFRTFADNLKYLRNEVAAAIEAGKTREQAMTTVNLEPLKEWQDMEPFLYKKSCVGWLYDELTRESSR